MYDRGAHILMESHSIDHYTVSVYVCVCMHTQRNQVYVVRRWRDQIGWRTPRSSRKLKGLQPRLTHSFPSCHLQGIRCMLLRCTQHTYIPHRAHLDPTSYTHTCTTRTPSHPRDVPIQLPLRISTTAPAANPRSQASAPHTHSASPTCSVQSCGWSNTNITHSLFWADFCCFFRHFHSAFECWSDSQASHALPLSCPSTS
jgi:hypothetical protein